MTQRTKHALDLGLELDRNERAELISRLIASLDEDLEPVPDWEDAWVAEVERRADSVREGTARLLPAEEVLKRVLGSLSAIPKIDQEPVAILEEPSRSDPLRA